MLVKYKKAATFVGLQFTVGVPVDTLWLQLGALETLASRTEAFVLGLTILALWRGLFKGRNGTSGLIFCIGSRILTVVGVLYLGMPAVGIFVNPDRALVVLLTSPVFGFLVWLYYKYNLLWMTILELIVVRPAFSIVGLSKRIWG